MADIKLTVNQVDQYVPGSRVTAQDISDAAGHIHEVTGLTVTEHSDEATDGLRLLPEATVRRAWAIVAARLAYFTRESTSGGVVSESGDGESFTINPQEAEKVRRDLLRGLPRDLLRLNHGQWARLGRQRPNARQSRAVTGYS